MKNLFRELLTVSVLMTAVWATAKPVKIICFGDSITKAARVSEEKSFIGILSKKLQQAGVQAQIVNAGVGGDKTSNGVARLQKAVLAQNPDFVVIMFGCNDSYVDHGKTGPRLPLAQFKKNLNYMVEELRKRKIVPVLMTTTPIDNKKVNYYPYSFHGANHFLKLYNNAVREIAKTKKIALVDNFADWEKYCMSGGKVGDLLFDAVHPNEAGYARIGAGMGPVMLQVLTNKNHEVKPEVVKDNRNLALGKSYVSSSRNNKSGWQAGLTDGKKTAVDGADTIVGGYATGPDANFPKTVVLDLESKVDVSRVLLYNMAKYGTKTVTVSVSTDGKTFREVGTQVFKKSDGKVYTYSLPKQPVRFVKIAFTDCYKLGHNYLFLREVEVYEN